MRNFLYCLFILASSKLISRLTTMEDILRYLQLLFDQQIQSLFKSKKSIKAKGEAPVLPNASATQGEDGTSTTTAADAASKLELAKKAAAR